MKPDGILRFVLSLTDSGGISIYDVKRIRAGKGKGGGVVDK